ncbi:MAG: glycosyltransferase family 4 protein [Pseudobdellovibrionaceae bacterium]
MKIAQVAPLYESVPPRLYGGTERVVEALTEELVRLGHDVSLFASGDSQTSAQLIPCCPQALRLDPKCRDSMAPHILMLQKVFERAEDFDLIHFHVDYLHFPLSKKMQIPQVTTLHGRLDAPELVPLFQNFSEMPLVSISNSQRTPLNFANWAGTVYHGLAKEKFEFKNEPGRYLAFLGRISPEKRADRAIEIAIRSGVPLKIAAKVDPADRIYFEKEIKPMLDHPLIDFIGEIGDRDKSAFLSNAIALLFPIDWPEPFGLVMIESMACGTPVIAFPSGSVPEVVLHGKTGFLIRSVDEAVEAVHRIPEIRRRDCREHFEALFSAERMAKDYVTIYERIIRSNHRQRKDTGSSSHSEVFEIRRPDLYSRELFACRASGPGLEA